MPNSDDLIATQADHAGDADRRQTDAGVVPGDELPSVFMPERRTGVERRSGGDRREGEERRSGSDRRRGAASVRSALASVAASVGEIAENATPLVSAFAERAGEASSAVLERATEAGSHVVDRATEAGSAVAEKAGGAVGAVVHAAGSAATPITAVAGVRRAEAARLRALRAAARRPLPSLWDVHPDARRASLRDIGIETVPLEKIRGTAVAGPTQRGGDFLPLRGLRGPNWEGRWQRIRRAVDRLETLPPVDLMKYGDEYWVVDGHNRVAAAKYADQVGIDASVVELRLPGMPRSGDTKLVGDLLAEQRKFQQAMGTSRRSRRPAPSAAAKDNEPEPSGSR
jgi:hypothetical protein